MILDYSPFVGSRKSVQMKQLLHDETSCSVLNIVCVRGAVLKS